MKKSGASLACDITLPVHFRTDDFLEFHRRDTLMVAERVRGTTLRKGLLWHGRPARLRIQIGDRLAQARLDIDGAGGGAEDAAVLERMSRRMLGLTQPIESFEKAYKKHPLLGPLIHRHRGLRVAVLATPFEALTWAILGQQISVSAAMSIRRRLIQAAGLKHSSGLYCHPDSAVMSRLSDATLQQAGVSRSKARTLTELAKRIQQKEVPLDEWLAGSAPVEQIRERLLAITGIGTWTVSYTLLRGFGWLDGSLHGDVAVRRNMRILTQSADKITAPQAEEWLAKFSPWRALVAAHLWSLQAPDGF